MSALKAIKISIPIGRYFIYAAVFFATLISSIITTKRKRTITAPTYTSIKMIDKNLNNKDDWKFFEEAFNNADKDFLKKVKSTHPSLTNNDLRLCAYLRLNLSSKDIAPLLNISLSSVEIKRYRLRKKMQLTHNEGLTDLIQNILKLINLIFLK